MPLVANLLSWLRRSFLALAALVVVLALAGAAYQILGNVRDPHRFPQRGRSVQVGKLNLNIDCSGHGGPTVILDSGMGVPGVVGWAMVQPEVAKFPSTVFIVAGRNASIECGPHRKPPANMGLPAGAAKNPGGQLAAKVLNASRVGSQCTVVDPYFPEL